MILIHTNIGKSHDYHVSHLAVKFHKYVKLQKQFQLVIHKMEPNRSVKSKSYPGFKFTSKSWTFHNFKSMVYLS